MWGLIYNQIIGIEEDAAGVHQLQCRVVEERPVLDAGTTGQDHLARRVSRVEVTTTRIPCALASPQTAAICSSVMVCLPPSRMLAVAKILITSPPSALVWRTISRSFAGAPDFSVIW